MAAGYRELVERVIYFLTARGAHVEIEWGLPFDESNGLSSGLPAVQMPEAVEQLYRQLGNGAALTWCAGNPIPNTPDQLRAASEIEKLTGRPFSLGTRYDGKASGVFRLLPISELVEGDLAHRRRVADQQFRHLKDQELAQRTLKRMRSWFGFHYEGNGDRFCVDTAANAGSVVFDQHDWFDGGSGDIGFVMARSLPEFFVQWASVCFQGPSWWPSVLTKTGVNWAAEAFEASFRLPQGA